MESSESFSGRMSIFGSINSFSLAMVFSKDNNNTGSKIKLDNMAKTKVNETKPPNATVPPKLEIMKTENPKNKTMEV